LNKDIVPQLSKHLSKRTKTIEDLLEPKLKWLAIHGMYGTGKTQLAALIKEYLGYQTTWISFKEVDDAFTEKLFDAFNVKDLKELEEQLSTLPSGKDLLIVLDDLPKFGGSDSFDQ